MNPSQICACSFTISERPTMDRILMGSGTGPIGSGSNTADPSLSADHAAVARAEHGLRRLLPSFKHVPRS